MATPAARGWGVTKLERTRVPSRASTRPHAAYAQPVCGRYTNTAGVEELNDRFRVPIEGAAGTRRFNVAPTEDVLAIVSPKGEPHARMLRWGLVPAWAHELRSAPLMINARMETQTRNILFPHRCREWGGQVRRAIEKQTETKGTSMVRASREASYK